MLKTNDYHCQPSFRDNSCFASPAELERVVAHPELKLSEHLARYDKTNFITMSAKPAPFIQNLWSKVAKVSFCVASHAAPYTDVLQDDAVHEIIEWAGTDGFVVHKIDEFTEQVLPRLCNSQRYLHGILQPV